MQCIDARSPGPKYAECGTTDTPNAWARVITLRISVTPPTLVMLGCAYVTAPTSNMRLKSEVVALFPATASAEGPQLNAAPFPATASAEGAQFNVPPSPAAMASPPAARTRASPTWSSGGHTGSSSHIGLKAWNLCAIAIASSTVHGQLVSIVIGMAGPATSRVALTD